MKLIKIVIINLLLIISSVIVYAEQEIAVHKILDNFNNGLNNFNINLPTKINQSIDGLFLYKLSSPYNKKLAPAYFLTQINNSENGQNLYGHLFGQLIQHFFIDVAGGYDMNNTAKYLAPISKNNFIYNKDWFASATALFTHTWKEFMFNANFGITHAQSNNQSFMFNSIPKWDPLLQNNLSFAQENAELSYQFNSILRPFVDGGVLQFMNVNNTVINTNKIGGGIALNYKQYILKLEQQYFQHGNMYLGNQSTISFKMNLG